MNDGASVHRRRVPTNVSLSPGVVAEARELGVNISKASEAGVEEAIAKARASRWLHDNEAALGSSNAYVEARDLPLRALRCF